MNTNPAGEMNLEESVNKILRRLPSGDDVVEDGHTTTAFLVLFKECQDTTIQALREEVERLNNKEKVSDLILDAEEALTKIKEVMDERGEG